MTKPRCNTIRYKRLMSGICESMPHTGPIQTRPKVNHIMGGFNDTTVYMPDIKRTIKISKLLEVDEIWLEYREIQLDRKTATQDETYWVYKV